MSKNTQPVFTKAPVVGMGTVTVANANLDGTGTIVEVVDGGADGVRLDLFEAKAIVTTTAGMLRIFLSLDSGVTWELWAEVAVTAATPAAAVPAFATELVFTKPLNLPDDTWRVGVSTENAEEQNVFFRGGSLSA